MFGISPAEAPRRKGEYSGRGTIDCTPIIHRRLTALLIIAMFALPTAVAAAQGPQPSRESIYNALLKGRMFDPDRRIVHLSHTCNLRIDSRYFPVVDLQELVKGAATPRGVNWIIIFDSALKPVQKIEYTTERPLFCLDNRLYVFGDLAIHATQPEGNVLTFTHMGKNVSVAHLEANDLPIVPSRERQQPPQ